MDDIKNVLIFVLTFGLLVNIFWENIKEKMGIIKQERKDPEHEKALKDAFASQQSSSTTQKARELFLDTLTKIGCQYKLGEGEDTRIYFDYQGEHFFADMNDDSIYVHIWDIYWGHVELYDIDEVSRLRKAINNSNLNTTVITVFTIDDDAKTMDVHCKSTIPFIASIPHLENYLRGELNEFFHAHRALGAEMHKLREQEQNA